LDGAADYRLLVNGELVGEATNPAVQTDYTVIRHTFEDIFIPVGAVIAVESLANTNGLIPEGDGTAFARGRWTGLELEEIIVDEPPVVVGPSDIDLSLQMVSSKAAVDFNESFHFNLRVSNSASSMTATQPTVTISIPLETISVVSADQCIENTRGLVCTFPEISASMSESMTLAFSSLETELVINVQAEVSADQSDRDGSNNAGELNITIADSTVAPEPEPVPEPTPIDQPPVEIPPPGTSMSSSSGSVSPLWLLLLVVASGRIKRRELKSST